MQFVRDVLIMKDEHDVVVQHIVKSYECLVINRRGDVHAVNLGADVFFQFSNCDCHCVSSNIIGPHC